MCEIGVNEVIKKNKLLDCLKSIFHSLLPNCSPLPHASIKKIEARIFQINLSHKNRFLEIKHCFLNMSFISDGYKKNL